MHAFMTAILLGMAGLNAFDANAQAQPPDGEFAQVEQSVGGCEGHAIIAADVSGQATFLEKPLKCGEREVFAGGGESFAAQQVTTGVIGDGERVAVTGGCPARTRLCNRCTRVRWDAALNTELCPGRAAANGYCAAPPGRGDPARHGWCF